MYQNKEIESNSFSLKLKETCALSWLIKLRRSKKQIHLSKFVFAFNVNSRGSENHKKVRYVQIYNSDSSSFSCIAAAARCYGISTLIFFELMKPM